MHRLNFSPLTRAILILLLLLPILPAWAQTGSTPYSMYGYGLLGDRATSMQRAMGGTGYGMNSGRQINVMNPASYASIDSLTFLFDMGITGAALWSTEKNTAGKNVTESTFGGRLDYVTMQFPLSKHIGMSVGMLPYSTVGYSFGENIAHGAMENQGSGGINHAYAGIAGRWRGLAVGMNASYAFGNIVNDLYTSIDDSSSKVLFEHVMSVKDYDLLFGAQYTARLSKQSRMTLGVTYTPAKWINGKTWATKQAISLDSKPDTLTYGKMNKLYSLPDSYGAGICYEYERTSRLRIAADYTWQNWSKATFSPLYEDYVPGASKNLIFQGMQCHDRIKYAAGMEFVPRLRGNYVERMAYRVGAYYSTDYLNIRNNSVREFGVTAGIGLHTPQDKTMINIGLEWKCRQAYPQQLINENYFNINLGVNFNELWFYQRKIK